MNQKDLKLYIEDLIRAAEYLEKEPIKFNDFDKTKIDYFISLGKKAINILKKIEDQEIKNLILEAEKYYNEKNKTKLLEVSSKIKENINNLKLPTKKTEKKMLDVTCLNLPSTLKNELISDFNEMLKCFESDCFKASIILCGRILETSLLRKYFEITGKDLLETAPGIGLGKIIGKLRNTGQDLGVGLNDQIHLINKIRIQSVHVKQKPFKPTKEQTQAILLYTYDVLMKIF